MNPFPMEWSTIHTINTLTIRYWITSFHEGVSWKWALVYILYLSTSIWDECTLVAFKVQVTYTQWSIIKVEVECFMSNLYELKISTVVNSIQISVEKVGYLATEFWISYSIYCSREFWRWIHWELIDISCSIAEILVKMRLAMESQMYLRHLSLWQPCKFVSCEHFFGCVSMAIVSHF